MAASFGTEEQEVPIPASILEREQRQQAQQQIQLRTSTSLATQLSPDQEVEVQSLSEKTHLAPDIVRRNIELVRKKAARNDVSLGQLQRDSPKTAQYLGVPSNAAVSSDDHQSLTTMEQIMAVPRSIVSSLAGPVIGRTLIGASEAVNITSRNLYPLIPPFIGQPLEEFLRQAGQEWEFRGQVHAPAQQNIVTQVIGGLSQFVPPVLATAAGHPELVPFMFGLQGLAAKKEEIDIRRVAAKQTPSPQAQDTAMLANALVFGATGEFGLNKLLKPVEQLLKVTPPSLRGRLLQYVGDVGLSGSRQGVVMAVQSMLSNVITKIAIDHDHEITKGLWEDMKVGGLTGAVARILFRMAIPNMHPQEIQAMDALQSKTQLQELSVAVKESKTQARRPENVAEHVENVTNNEKHYISAKAILKYAAETNRDPAKVADEITANGSDKVAATLAGGEDVIIPISDYTQRVANFDHQVFYDDNVRRGSPEAMTAIEAEEFFKAAAEPPPPEEQAQQEERQANLEALHSPEVTQAIDEQMATLGEIPTAPEAKADFLQGVEDRIRERIRKRGVRLAGGLDPLELADYGMLGAVKIARGVRDFAAWSQEMLAEYGPKIQPKLREIYDQAIAEAARLRPQEVHAAAAKKALATFPAPPELSSVGILEGSETISLPTIEAIAGHFTKENRSLTKKLEDPKVIKRITDAMYHEALYALTDNGNAVGWYDSKVRAALDLLAEAHPEILTDPNAKFAFTTILAVTSNGMRSKQNFVIAEQLYRTVWKQGGKFPEALSNAGPRAPQMVEAFKTLNRLMADMGIEKLSAFMLEKHTARDIAKLVGESGSFGEQAGSEHRGSLFLGAKIGSFFANLNGIFDTLTMDRWWMRTMNRLRGRMLALPGSFGVGLGALREQLKSGVDTYGVDGQKAIAEIEAYLQQPAEKQSDVLFAKRKLPTVLEYVRQRTRDYASPKDDGTGTGRKVSFRDRTPENYLAKNLFLDMTGSQDSPAGAKDRAWIRQIVGKVQEQLSAAGIPLTTADFQALLWYYEKNLYAKIKSKEGGIDEEGTTEPEDYETAARHTVRQLREQGLLAGSAGSARPAAGGAAAPGPGGRGTFLDRVETQARERIQKRGVRLAGGFDPAEFADYTILAGAKIARGVIDFTQWSREMITAFGEPVLPYLRELYVKSLAEAARTMGVTAEQMKQGLESLTVDALMAQAETETGATSLYTTAELAQMTPEEFVAHRAIANKADDQRRAKLESAIRKSIERQRTADREAIEAQVRPQIEGQHDYQALTALKTKTMPDGSPIPKLDTAALKQMYGEFSESPERQALKKLDLYRDQGGIHPDLAAEKLGYQSGDEMVQRLIALPPMEEAIRDAVDAQLSEKYPDMLATGEAQREARKLANTVGRSDVIEADLRRLAAQIPETPEIAKLAQEQQREATKAGLAAVTRRPSFITKREARKNAEAEIASMRVRDITPGLYSAAAQREAKAAIDAFAAGDLKGALAAKQRDLISTERYRAASNAKIEAEKIADNQRSYDRPAKRARIAKSGQYYLDRIDAYRNGADFARVTNKSLDKQTSLAQFIQRELDAGQPVDAATLAAVNEGKSYRDMTLAELRQLDAAVEHVNHLSKLKTDMMTSAATRDFDEKRDDIVESIVESQPRVRKDARIKGTDATLAYEAMRKFHRWNAAHRAASSLAFELDGFREGPFRRALFHPGTDAGLRQTQLLNEFVERITPLFEPVIALGGMQGRGVYFPSINRTLNRTKRIVLALQMGTETGEQRLLGGDGWTLAQVQPVLDSLSPVELQLVQGIFDHFETYRKEAGELERRTTGNEVEWLERKPIVTKNGTIPGGYYPVKFDLERSTKAQRQADAAAAQNQLQGAYTGSTTSQTYLKSRVPEVYDRPIDLASFRGLWEGTNEVIHDLAFRPFLIDANRIIRDPQIEAAIRDRKGAEGIKVFTSWIEDTAKGDAQAQTIIDHAINYTVRGVTTATLAYRLASGLKQIPDLAFAASRIGKGWVARAVMQSLSAPKETYAFVMEDPLMQERGAGSMLQRDLESIRKQVQGEGPVKRAIYGSFFVFNRVFQQMVDIPTYLAQYNKSFAEHGDEAQARREARQTVIDTQGSSEKQNLPQVMRSRTLRLLTLFYHGFAIQHQAVAERTQRGMRVFQREGVSVKSAVEAVKLGTDYLMIYGAQAAMGAAITHWFYDRDDESWAKTLIREGLQGLVGEQIFLREGEGVAEKVLGLEEYRRDYQGPAALRFLVTLERLADQAHQGEWDKAYRHAVINGLAMASGGRIPGSQTNATLDAIIALWEGETQNPLTLISGPPQE